MVEQRRAGRQEQLVGVRTVGHDEVPPLADVQGAALAAEVQAVGGVEGGPHDDLSGRQAEPGRRHSHRRHQRGGVDGGAVVGGDRNRHVAVDEQAGVSPPVGHVDQLRHRQHDRHGVGRPHVVDLLIRCVGEVLGGDGALAGGRRPALRGVPGVGVDPRLQSQLPAPPHQPTGLGGSEQALLHGHVVELSDALADHRRKHLAGDQVGVGLAGLGAAVACADVPRHHVGAQEADHQAHGAERP